MRCRSECDHAGLTICTVSAIILAGAKDLKGIAMKTIRLATAALVLVCAQSASAEEAYSDNRSSAADLIRSLYNAVNHHEFARAFEYYATPPAKDFASFEAGYNHTVRVDVITGDVTSDGTAGTMYYNVPTAIKATDDKGGSKVFLGCYTVKAVSASVQEPPFRPFQIDKGALKPGKADDFTTYSLPKCGDAPADEMPAKVTVDTVKATFIAQQQGYCQKVEETRAGLNEPHEYKIKYKQAGAEAADPLMEVSLFVFDCTMAAYNESQVFYLTDSYGSEVNLLSFAEPHLAITYENDDVESKKLKSLSVEGYTSTNALTNADFDEKTNSITSFSKWRGIGDASSSGTWVFAEGQFVLKDFAVDPTYDEDQNPVSIMENGKLKK
jgi:Protein of unknown function (DUF1176)